MTTGTVTLAAFDTELFTDTVNGPANFDGYIGFKNMVPGDVVEIVRYQDVENEDDNDFNGPIEVTFQDVQKIGTFEDIPPFSLQANQTFRIGITLKAGTLGLEMGWRITDLKTGG